MRLLERRWLYRSCRVIHTVSDSLRRHLVELGFSSSRIRAIANGVDAKSFFPGASLAARRQIGIDVDGPTIGVVGRFVASKRHELLLAAFERFSKDWPLAQLLVVGAGGPEYDRVVHSARSGPCANRIHFAGFQENPSPYYRAMDLLVLPSTGEGMSNVALEAMACGVPVLSHASCGAAEILTSGYDGFVANLETPEALAIQLRSILGDAQRLVKIGERARATAVQRFSLAGMVRKYEQLYWNTAQDGYEREYGSLG
jgi:glycosyltransferase involved in cell wall biosynthesis